MDNLVSALKKKAKKSLPIKDFKDEQEKTSRTSTSKEEPIKKKKKSRRPVLPFSNQKNLHGAVRVIEIKAGRKQNKSHRKRHKFGPKKGEVVTSTDENEDEENMNTSDWSDSSIDDNDRRDKTVKRPLLATGPSVPNTGKPTEAEPVIYDDSKDAEEALDALRRTNTSDLYESNTF